MKIRAFLASVGTALALCLASPAWAVYVVTVDAPATGVQGTDVTVNVNLAISDFDSVDTVGFSLSYDTSVLSFLSGSLGALNASWVTFSSAASPSGLVNVSTTDNNLLGVFGADSGSIAALTFRLIGVGASDLGLSAVLLDNFQTFPVGFQPNTISNASIFVQANNQVPVPGTVLLVGVGLMLLGWTRRNAS